MKYFTVNKYNCQGQSGSNHNSIHTRLDTMNNRETIIYKAFIRNEITIMRKLHNNQMEPKHF
jgi:hypothetical protein